MGRILDTWRSWSLRRRLTVAGGAIACVAGVAFAGYFLFVKRPADVACPAPCHLKTQAQPKKRPSENWPVYGYNAERTRYLPTKKVNPPFSKPLWEFDAGRLLEFSPILVDHVLYDMDKAAIMYAIRAGTGKVIWKKDLGSLNASAAAYSHGVLFASTLEPGEIVALRAKDGKLLWHHPLPGRSETSPLVYGGKVLVGCECGDILALNPKNGKTIWTVPSDGPVKGGVAVHKGIAFIGNYAGQLFAIRVSDGHIKWEASSQGLSFGRTGSFYSTPAVAFGRVYAGNIDGRVYSFNEETGQLLWSHSTGGYVYAGPAVADTPDSPPTVYIGSADHNFYALDAATGNVRWQKDVGGAILGAGSVIGDTAYVSGIGDNIGTFGYDVNHGGRTFKSPFGEYNPAISDDQRLYLTGSSKILALRPQPKHKHQAHGKHDRHGSGEGHKKGGNRRGGGKGQGNQGN